jgi:hypothetical protein
MRDIGTEKLCRSVAARKETWSVAKITQVPKRRCASVRSSLRLFQARSDSAALLSRKDIAEQCTSAHDAQHGGCAMIDSAAL